MKKGVAIIGSPRQNRSISRYLCLQLFEEIKINFREFEYELFMLPDLNINKCIGCTECFRRSDSCIQFQDDLQMLENKMLESDLIIFASPVYAHNITGDMKIFFDRITYWTHLLRLVGKYGIAVSVSSSSGNCYVDEFLCKTMEYIGLCLIGNISYSGIKGFDMSELSRLAQETIQCLKNRKLVNTEFKENIFQNYKATFVKIYENSLKDPNLSLNAEAKFWLDNNYLDCNSFIELFQNALMKNH